MLEAGSLKKKNQLTDSCAAALFVYFVKSLLIKMSTEYLSRTVKRKVILPKERRENKK